MLLNKILLLIPVASALDLSFPPVFSATRVIYEKSGPSRHQLGYLAHDYTKGMHMEARTVDNITYDEGIQHDHTQQAWTVWRDVKTLKESRCEQKN